MDGRLEILAGDCRAILPTLPAESVQCCVTSPPYWGLRDYGTAQWEGGDGGCDHIEFIDLRLDSKDGKLTGTRGTQSATRIVHTYRGNCHKCGACRVDSQLGLEATPEEYITKMVAVFREVWRVLRDDGTLWVNVGDSYAGSNASQGGNGTSGGLCRDGRKETTRIAGHLKLQQRLTSQNTQMKGGDGLKPKDLCGIPWRLAFALQAAGWYLRSDIIWAKPNPMPESVTDRPTKAHEYIFLLTKAERYFYDSEAIRERTGSEMSWDEYAAKTAPGETWPSGGITRYAGTFKTDGGQSHPNGRNKRTVWAIATQPYSEAHFATFPEEIPKLCILAGSKPGDTILDPFAGSGTVGKVALELGRRAVMIELNPDYIALAHERTNVTPGWF